jgi:LysR family pca operon transcriptional activator
MMAWRGGKRPNPAREAVLATARSLAKRWRNE